MTVTDETSAKISRKQEQCIAALLACSSIIEAAQHCGVAEVTMHRWLRQESFQAAYRDSRRQVMQHAIAQIQQITSEAVETLRAVMKDPDAPASAKVSAARTVIESALRAVELEDISVRLEALERAQNGGVV